MSDETSQDVTKCQHCVALTETVTDLSALADRLVDAEQRAERAEGALANERDRLAYQQDSPFHYSSTEALDADRAEDVTSGDWPALEAGDE